EGTIEDLYEPFLIQMHYLTKTPQGRQITGKGYEHLGMVPPAGLQENLF
nr:Holliday junction branch migration DNA helicase RuvB [Planctomycetota bacterium]